MRLRADKVRAGHRLGGATVTRVRPTLDWGMVRITVEGTDARTAPEMPNGTFCYLADDILEVDTSAPAEIPAQRSHQG